MLINLVGCDGCGKTTQLEMLKPWLKQCGVSQIREIRKKDIFDFDQFPIFERLFGCSYRELMWELLPQMPAESRALFLFYMLASISCRYPPSEDEIVLLDGGWHKHFAAEAAMGLSLDWLKQVGSFFPTPDISVLLDIEPETILERRIADNYGPHAPYECACKVECHDVDFLSQMSNMREYLLGLAKTERWAIVDAQQSKEDVFEEIQGLLREPVCEFIGGIA